MGVLRKAAFCVLLAMVTLLEVIRGAVYKVGDSTGWTTLGNPNYKQWAATKNFQVGDVIVFQYNPQFHNVMQVTHTMYRSCNNSSPLATYTTGNDSITITTKGHHYFLCGIPGHCQIGQKVDINVLRDGSTAPTPSPSTSGSGSDSGPAPAPNGATSLKPLKSIANGPFAMIGLAMAVMALVVMFN